MLKHRLTVWHMVTSIYLGILCTLLLFERFFLSKISNSLLISCVLRTVQDGFVQIRARPRKSEPAPPPPPPAQDSYPLARIIAQMTPFIRETVSNSLQSNGLLHPLDDRHLLDLLQYLQPFKLQPPILLQIIHRETK